MAPSENTRGADGRNSNSPSDSSLDNSSPSSPHFSKNTSYRVVDIERAISREHRSLLRTRALLGCLVVALNESQSEDENDPDYADVAQIACRRVQASVDRLEAILT